MARHRPADDARAIGKIYPMDRHGPGHPHHDARPGAHNDRSLGGKPARYSDLERVKPGGDPTDKINALYAPAGIIRTPNPTTVRATMRRSLNC